jgi:FkbM family methyltransferase
VCSEKWASEADSLLRQGVPADRVIRMPIPLNDTWTYWTLSEALLPSLSFDGGASLPIGHFAAYATGSGRAKASDTTEEVQVKPQSYVCYFPELVQQNAYKIASVTAALADDRSRTNYARVLVGEPKDVWGHYIETCFDTPQYFHHVCTDHCPAMINGGIWTGTEIPQILAVLPPTSVIHNVDPLGYRYLTDHARRTLAHFRGRCVEHKLALAGHDGTLSLGLHPSGQAVGTEGKGAQSTQDFPCETIDSFCARVGFARHGLIKLDLEGAEAVVVPKMAETVAALRPQLAISIYHEIEHLWDLPLQLMAMCRDYDFYVEHYSWERWKVLLYCIPKELRT